MKSPKFTYACPRSVEEALALLAHGGDEAKILVGGQSLVPLLNLRTAQVSALVDVNRLSELSFIKRENGALRVGALTRHRQLEISEDARTALPLIARAAAQVGHLAIRNRGTVGGSVVHADPAAEWPLVTVTLDAQLVLRSQNNTRTVAARDFFLVPPGGIKGMGEGGAIAPPAAVANAIADALSPFGVVRINEIPLTPERVLAAICAGTKCCLTIGVAHPIRSVDN
jgi:aerobic carbon-monoxide dehydrogenase medium subunit